MLNPYNPFIQNIFTNVDFDFIKKNEIKIYPIEIMDSDNFFTIDSFHYYKNILISSQKNGTVLSISNENTYFKRVWNRTIPLMANDIKPLLSLGKFAIRMFPTTEVTLRTYDNLSNFLATTGAI